jgi:hypothetical protein
VGIDSRTDEATAAKRGGVELEVLVKVELVGN